MDKLLTIDPEKRINADTALSHDFFWKDPMPSNLAHLLSQLTTNNFEYFIRQPKPAQKPPPESTSGFHDRIY